MNKNIDQIIDYIYKGVLKRKLETTLKNEVILILSIISILIIDEAIIVEYAPKTSIISEILLLMMVCGISFCLIVLLSKILGVTYPSNYEGVKSDFITDLGSEIEKRRIEIEDTKKEIEYLDKKFTSIDRKSAVVFGAIIGLFISQLFLQVTDHLFVTLKVGVTINMFIIFVTGYLFYIYSQRSNDTNILMMLNKNHWKIVLAKKWIENLEERKTE